MSKDEGTSGKLLKLLTSCLTIFGGIATILACVIAFIALVNPNQTQGVIVQIFSEGTPTPLVVTVVVTPTPLSGTATNTPQPTSTPEPTHTNTPVPTATPISVTELGTILKPGEKWYGDGLVLLLKEPVEILPEALRVTLVVNNISDQQILFEMRQDKYRMISSLNEEVLLGHDLKQGGISLQPGEELMLSNRGIFRYNLANANVEYVIVEVDMGSRLEKAQWRVDIPH